jgi:hypothetical protein
MREALLPGEVGAVFREAYRWTDRKVEESRYTFSFRCYMLDDEFDEIWWRFCQWIAPYSESTGCIGYYREQQDWQPTLIYFIEGKVHICEVDLTPREIGSGGPWPPSGPWSKPSES